MSGKNTLYAIAPLLLVSVLSGCFPQYGGGNSKADDGPGRHELPRDDMWSAEEGHVYTELRQVSYSEAGEDFDPFLTKNGKKVIYASTRISPKSDIFLQAIGSRVIEQITATPNANEKQPQISPDGNHVVFASDKSGKWNIYEKTLKIQSNSELELLNNGRVNEQPCYSPDGKFIVYSTWLPRKGVWAIATLNRETQQETIYGPGMYPKYSPDGTKILFQRPRVRIPQWFSIWVLDIPSLKNTEIVSNANYACVTPNWSPDGKKIIFAAINKNPGNPGPYAGDDIYTISIKGTHMLRITKDNAPDWNPIWGKDNRVYFISKRNGFQNIWSINPRNMDQFHPDTIESAASIRPEL